MKIKSLKEKNTMPEVIGVKVKDFETTTSTVDPIEPESVTPVDNAEVNPDFPDFVDTVTPVDNTKVEETKENEVTVEDTTPATEEKDEYEKVATARLVDYNGTTIYRFDIYNKEFGKDNGIVEYRNIVNNFESARPSGRKDYKDFFAMYGIITWNFNSKVMPYDKNILALITQLESLINEHITIAGIKKDKFTFKIDTVEDFGV